ncbi:MAG: hypothetical protein ACTSQJ_14915, partial [Promethearchaeota archaeon]
PELQSFIWCKSITILMRLAFIFILINIIIFEFLLLKIEIIWFILFLIAILIIIIYFGIKILFDMSRIIIFGKKYHSKNIIVKIPAKNKQLQNALIIFSAHYDSISVKYSYKTQKFLYIIGGVLFLFYIFFF